MSSFEIGLYWKPRPKTQIQETGLRPNPLFIITHFLPILTPDPQNFEARNKGFE